MISRTGVIRSAGGMVGGSLLLVCIAVVPAGVLLLSGSLIAALACLAVALMAGALVFTLMSANKLAYGPAGVYVVADDESLSLTWDLIDKFDYDTWVIVADSRNVKESVRGLTIRLKSGRSVPVDWINTKRTVRRLNAALAVYAGRPVPELSPKPPTEATRLTSVALFTFFNIGVLRLTFNLPWVLLVGILVDIMAVSVYMGVKMSKGE